MNKFVLVSSLLVALLLSGCSSSSRRSEAPAPVTSSRPADAGGESQRRDQPGSAVSGAGAEVRAYEPAAPIATTPSYGDAVVALLDSADRQQRDGNLPAAVATLERALRIEPRNASLWQELASLRLQQGEYRMAADLAAKSNNLAGGDRQLKQQNWRLLARARGALGDRAGAREAERQAQALR